MLELIFQQLVIIAKTIATITLSIGLLLGNLGGGILSLNQDYIDYPVMAITKIDKLEYAYIAQETLRLEHNEMGAKYRNEEITEQEWNTYLKDIFKIRSEWIGGEIGIIRNELGYSLGIDYKTATKKEKDEKERQKEEEKAFKKSKRWDINTTNVLNTSIAQGAVEDFSGYTEADPSEDITKTSTRITFTNLPRNQESWVVKDYTAGFFDGDFEHLLTVRITASHSSGQGFIWALANEIGSWSTLTSGTKRRQGIDFFRGYLLYLREGVEGGSEYTSGSYNAAINNIYYLKIKRVEAIGTYGTTYNYTYDDSGRTNLIDTRTLTLHEKSDFRYVYGLMTLNDSTPTQSGYVENLDLQEPDPPVISEPQMKVIFIQ